MYNSRMIDKFNKVKVTTYLGKMQLHELKILAQKMETSYATLIRIAVGEYLKNKEREK